jgi:hypothetical protein
MAESVSKKRGENSRHNSIHVSTWETNMASAFCATQGVPNGNIGLAALIQTSGTPADISELFGGPNNVKEAPPIASFPSPVLAMAAEGDAIRRYYFGATDQRIYFAHRIGELPMAPTAFGMPPNGYFPLTVPLASDILGLHTTGFGGALAVLLGNGDVCYAIGTQPGKDISTSNVPALLTVTKVVNLPNAARLCAYYSQRTVMTPGGQVIQDGQGDDNMHIIVAAGSAVIEVFFNPYNPAGAGTYTWYSFSPPGRPGDIIRELRGFSTDDGFQHVVVAVSHQDAAGNVQEQLHEITYKPGVQPPAARLIASVGATIEGIWCIPEPNNGGTVVALLTSNSGTSQVYSGSYAPNGSLTLQPWSPAQQIPFFTFQPL